jgi:hypothetical protein
VPPRPLRPAPPRPRTGTRPPDFLPTRVCHPTAPPRQNRGSETALTRRCDRASPRISPRIAKSPSPTTTSTPIPENPWSSGVVSPTRQSPRQGEDQEGLLALRNPGPQHPHQYPNNQSPNQLTTSPNESTIPSIHYPLYIHTYHYTTHYLPALLRDYSALPHLPCDPVSVPCRPYSRLPVSPCARCPCSVRVACCPRCVACL